MSALLDKAQEQLDSSGPHALRRACWLARGSLEEVIEALLSAKGIDAHKASARAKLSSLEGAYVDDRELTSKADYAWNRLSDACHHHAYQLSPTHSEAKQLIDTVRELGDSLASANSNVLG